MPTIRRPAAVLACLVPLLVAGVLCPVSPRAETPPGGTSAETFPQWWGGAGRPGWSPEASWAGGMPWTFAGLTAGSWQLNDPLAPSFAPDPGIAEAQVPMAWYDSAAVVVGEDAAWNGWGAGLVSARGFVHAPGGRKPRAMFSLVSGGNGLDRNGIFVSRGDERSWVRLGATGNRRGGMGDLDVAGDHLWTLGTGGGGDRARWDAGFTQRGMGETQRDAVAESGHGQNGHAGVRGWFGRDSLDFTIARGFDGRLRRSAGFGGAPVWRDAQQDGADLQAWRRVRDRAFGLRAQWRDARVTTFIAGAARSASSRESWTSRSLWLSARALRPWAGGQLDLQVGAGTDRNVGHSPVVPSATWRMRRDDRTLRLFVERAYVPVWSDLAPGVTAFRQDTWTTGFEAGAGEGRATSGSLLVLAGRTGARATLWRYPVRAAGILEGWQRDGAAYRFVLVQGSAARRGRHFGGDARGYALARPRSGSQARVDPGLGATVGLESMFAVFAGDLAVRLRVEGSYVGARETDARVIEDLMLPSYTELGVALTATLGDATIAVRGEHLGTPRQPESWPDLARAEDGVLGRDAGPQWRTSVTWPLFN